MKNFILGVIVGVAIAACGYKPYQIEMEYRHNVSAPLEPQSLIRCFHRGSSMTCVDTTRPVPRDE